MNSKSLSHLKHKKVEKNIITRNVLQKLKQQNNLRQMSEQQNSTKRVVWSGSHKMLSQPSEKQMKMSKEKFKLGLGQQKSKFSTKIQSIEILKPISDRMMSSKRSSSSNISPVKPINILESKLRVETTVFSRGLSDTEIKMKMYLSNMLLKGDQKQLIFIEQANDSFAKISPFPWNVTVSLFSTLSTLLKNSSFSICQRYALAYLSSDYQTTKNELEILSIFEDNSHLGLICESFYYQRVIALVLAVQSKSQELQLHQMEWIGDMIKRALIIRGLILEIVNQYEQSFLKFNKLKKPSYLIREKKLISINKTMNEQKDIFQKLLKFSPLKRYNFDVKTPLTHLQLLSKSNLLKLQMLHMPLPPFLSLKTQKYCLICDPQGIFYTQDKKNTCIIIKPFAQEMIKKLTERCEVVIFSRRREKSLAAFVKQIGVELFAGVLDRSFMTFREGKKIKDLDKLGINLNKTIILDLNFEKYFSFWKENCIPISKNDEESELQNIVKQIQQIINEEVQIKGNIIASFFKKPSMKIEKQ